MVEISLRFDKFLHIDLCFYKIYSYEIDKYRPLNKKSLK